VLAIAAGCREAITFTTGRDLLGADSSDSGTRIGALLGLKVTEYDPTSYRARQDLPEAECVATGGGGGSVVLTAAEDRLPGNILLTRHYGGEAWERVNNKGGPGMVTFDSAGADPVYCRSRRARLAAQRIGARLPDVPSVLTGFRNRRTQHRLLFHWGMKCVEPRYSERVQGSLVHLAALIGEHQAAVGSALPDQAWTALRYTHHAGVSRR
jgi:hypothetical protein